MSPGPVTESWEHAVTVGLYGEYVDTVPLDFYTVAGPPYNRGRLPSPVPTSTIRPSLSDRYVTLAAT